jgi:hypothetical protein
MFWGHRSCLSGPRRELQVSGTFSTPSCVTPCRKRAYPHPCPDSLSLGVPCWRPESGKLRPQAAAGVCGGTPRGSGRVHCRGTEGPARPSAVTQELIGLSGFRVLRWLLGTCPQTPEIFRFGPIAGYGQEGDAPCRRCRHALCKRLRRIPPGFPPTDPQRLKTSALACRAVFLPCYWRKAENLPRTTASGVPGSRKYARTG